MKLKAELPAGVAHASQERLGYRPGLDGLRAVAILAVMASHTWESLVPGGFLGVDIFFVLSGFLITTLLLEERDRRGRVSLRLFYARRALRLLPALAVLLAAVGVWILLSAESPLRQASLRGLPAVALYAANWVWGVHGTYIGVVSHAWSLSLEEQFYLLWPGVLLVFFAVLGFVRGQTAALWACTAVIGLAAIVRWESVKHNFDDESLRQLTQTRGDVLLVGCLLALVAYRGWLRRVPKPAATATTVASIAVLAYFAVGVRRGVEDPIFFKGGFTLIALASAVLIVRVVHIPSAGMLSVLAARPMVAIGRISYALYLWHTPIRDVLRSQFAWVPSAVQPSIAIPLAFLAATASYFFVEKPALRLKDRLMASRAEPLPLTPSMREGAARTLG